MSELYKQYRAIKNYELALYHVLSVYQERLDAPDPDEVIDKKEAAEVVFTLKFIIQLNKQTMTYFELLQKHTDKISPATLEALLTNLEKTDPILVNMKDFLDCIGLHSQALTADLESHYTNQQSLLQVCAWLAFVVACALFILSIALMPVPFMVIGIIAALAMVACEVYLVANQNGIFQENKKDLSEYASTINNMCAGEFERENKTRIAKGTLFKQFLSHKYTDDLTLHEEVGNALNELKLL